MYSFGTNSKQILTKKQPRKRKSYDKLVRNDIFCIQNIKIYFMLKKNMLLLYLLSYSASVYKLCTNKNIQILIRTIVISFLRSFCYTRYIIRCTLYTSWRHAWYFYRFEKTIFDERLRLAAYKKNKNYNFKTIEFTHFYVGPNTK